MTEEEYIETQLRAIIDQLATLQLLAERESMPVLAIRLNQSSSLLERYLKTMGG